MVKNISKKEHLTFLGNTSSSNLFKFGLLDLVIFADLYRKDNEAQTKKVSKTQTQVSVSDT